jgi:uncharacterized integral membrane protein (TIGR00698 family)
MYKCKAVLQTKKMKAEPADLKTIDSIAKFIFPLGAIFALSPYATSASALVLGMILAIAFGNPYLAFTKKWTSRLLTYAVVGLGFGMNLAVVGKVGVQGIGYTVVGILSTMTLGYFLGKWYQIPEDTSLLVTVGTAICGGSAIAAVAPTINAKAQDVSVSLATVFLLNAIALIIFPPIGHLLHLDQTQFGLWCALAIHDTSSVVGASMQFGAQALQVGTTVKLARALWIIPVTLFTGAWYARKTKNEVGSQPSGPAKKPWFILGFLLAAALVTYIPSIESAGHEIENLARHLLVLTLFLIGANLTRDTLRAVGVKPLLQGITLWMIVGTATLFAIVGGVIHG